MPLLIGALRLCKVLLTTNRSADIAHPHRCATLCLGWFVILDVLKCLFEPLFGLCDSRRFVFHPIQQSDNRPFGIENKKPVRTVLVQFEASSQLGFLMETLADGRHVVFVPGVPKALIGTLHIIAVDRVQLLDLSIPSALDVLGRLGVGLREKWPAELPRFPGS